MEKAELVVACLKDAGFEAEVYEIGVYIHGPQLEAAEAALSDCQAEVDALYGDPPALSDPEYYQALIASRDCLRAQGIEVSTPPTFDAWMEGGRQWSPFSEIPDSADFWDLHRFCPQSGLGLTPETTTSP